MNDLVQLIKKIESLPKSNGNLSSSIMIVNEINSELEKIIKDRIRNELKLNIDSSSERFIRIGAYYRNEVLST